MFNSGNFQKGEREREREKTERERVKVREKILNSFKCIYFN